MGLVGIFIQEALQLIFTLLGHTNVFICFASFENPKNLPASKGEKQMK
jgi:hypothetical protein